METKHIMCDCYSPEHTLRFGADLEEKDLYISVFLNEQSFLKRIWSAIKYIVGYKCKYGHFDEFYTADIEKMIEIREIFDKVIKAKEK